MWIGIDIGCAEGKNDGSIQGKKYFDCSPNHGIFVKESAVTKFIENPKNIGIGSGGAEAGSGIDSEKESNLLLKRIENILLNQTNNTRYSLTHSLTHARTYSMTHSHVALVV